MAGVVAPLEAAPRLTPWIHCQPVAFRNAASASTSDGAICQVFCPAPFGVHQVFINRRAAPEVSRRRYRHQRGELPGRRLRRRGSAGGERRQHSPHDLRAQDPHCRCRNPEDDSARAGPGGIPETPRPQRHRPVLLTVYTSFLSSARRSGEVDGPDESYVVLLDNGRTRLLPDRGKRQSLYCIRCGACLNTCPVYRKIGGHSFPWVYSGPIGAIITPQYMGISHEPALPFASSLCGACSEVCPVKIDIPEGAPRAALGREKGRGPRPPQPPRETCVPRLRLVNDPSAAVRNGRTIGTEFMSEPKIQKVPPDVISKVNSRWVYPNVTPTPVAYLVFDRKILC